MPLAARFRCAGVARRFVTAPLFAVALPFLVAAPSIAQTPKPAATQATATEKMVVPLLEEFRQTVVVYDLAYNVTDRDAMTGPNNARLARYPFRAAWPSMLNPPARKASGFSTANAATGDEGPPVRDAPSRGLIFVGGPLKAGFTPENGYSTLLFPNGIAQTGAVMASANMYVKGDMAGLINSSGYCTLVVKGDFTGSAFFESYGNAVITGQCRGTIAASSSSKLYVMGGLGKGAGIFLGQGAGLYLGGKTDPSTLSAISGSGTVYVENADLPPGEYKLGAVRVFLLPPTAPKPVETAAPVLTPVNVPKNAPKASAPTPAPTLVAVPPANLRAIETPDDIADVPNADLHVGADTNKRYLLMGPSVAEGQNPKTAPVPPGGYKLLLVLPGGDGSPDFHPFIARMVKNALPPGYLVAQLCAVPWTPDQAENLVWPTKQNTVPEAKFTTEEYMEAVVADIKAHHKINDKGVFALGWSSSGPPVYSAILQPNSALAGGFVAMSIFQPGSLPALTGAKNKAFYLLHSPQDFIKITQAESARDMLTENGAKTTLTTYKGGHGWTENVWGNIEKGVLWLQTNTSAASPARTLPR